jgi:hypothetical protein
MPQHAPASAAAAVAVAVAVEFVFEFVNRTTGRFILRFGGAESKSSGHPA